MRENRPEPKARRSAGSAAGGRPTGEPYAEAAIGASAPVGEPLGRRIADLRAKLGWTQQELSDRVGISRVAVSHLEAGLTDPGERTIALLASVFKIEPVQLVAGTAYPAAKAERLPVVVARFTEAEHHLALFDNDLLWIERLRVSAHPSAVPLALDAIERWQTQLAFLVETAHDGHEKTLLVEALAKARYWLDDVRRAGNPASLPAGQPVAAPGRARSPRRRSS